MPKCEFSHPPFAVTISNTERPQLVCMSGFSQRWNPPPKTVSDERKLPNLQTTVNGEIKLLEPASPCFRTSRQAMEADDMFPTPEEGMRGAAKHIVYQFTGGSARERCWRRDGNVRAPRGSTPAWIAWLVLILARHSNVRNQLCQPRPMGVWMMFGCLITVWFRGRNGWFASLEWETRELRTAHVGAELNLNWIVTISVQWLCHQKFEALPGEVVVGGEDWVFHVIAFNLRCGFWAVVTFKAAKDVGMEFLVDYL